MTGQLSVCYLAAPGQRGANEVQVPDCDAGDLDIAGIGERLTSRSSIPPIRAAARSTEVDRQRLRFSV
jgi:hypothetical protein